MIAGLMSTEMGLLAVIASEGIDSLTPYVRDFLEQYGDKMGPKYAVEAEELLIATTRKYRKKFSCAAFRQSSCQPY